MTQQHTPDLGAIRTRQEVASKALERLERISFSDSTISRDTGTLVASWRDVAPLLEYLEQQPASAELVADVATYAPTPEDRAAAARSQAAEIATRLEVNRDLPTTTSWRGYADAVHAFLAGESATPTPAGPASAAGLAADVVQNATELEKALAGMVLGGYALLEDVDGDPVIVNRGPNTGRLRIWVRQPARGEMVGSVEPKQLDYPARLVVLREQGAAAADDVA